MREAQLKRDKALLTGRIAGKINEEAGKISAQHKGDAKIGTTVQRDKSVQVCGSVFGYARSSRSLDDHAVGQAVTAQYNRMHTGTPSSLRRSAPTAA